ncbi:HNH endonuclease [Caulobacter hibisci]|uniref:HNH endonuclease n=1 Tax=Caulobacter hibisci TaxID=2035993 RepID=A0ABS0SSK0_9CAUL|nr:HNH endonuclease [Caulobacter hibisci]
MPGQWHANRFIEDAARHHSPCIRCGRSMWLPASKLGIYVRCSPECKAAAAAAQVRARSRPCETCGGLFAPRQVQLNNGGGRFCSQKCNTAARAALQAPETKLLAARRLREDWASGKLTAVSGPAKPNWKGGKAARKERLRTPEARAAQAATLRAYRKANPDKVREFVQSRSRRQHGKLPRGTVKRLGEMQAWRCAICRVGVKRGFHLDHIMPLARGGEHAPRNLQLLCATCNVRKSSRDPIEHMQSLGRLL